MFSLIFNNITIRENFYRVSKNKKNRNNVTMFKKNTKIKKQYTKQEMPTFQTLASLSIS